MATTYRLPSLLLDSAAASITTPLWDRHPATLGATTLMPTPGGHAQVAYRQHLPQLIAGDIFMHRKCHTHTGCLPNTYQDPNSPSEYMLSSQNAGNPPRFSGNALPGIIQPLTNGYPRSSKTVVTGPFNYTQNLPGKNLRGQMINAFNAWLNVPPESLDVIAKVVTTLHTASLLIDDIEDDSFLRRGYPAAHHLFGVPQTINSANYMYFRAFDMLQSLDSADVVRIFTDELLQLHLGQGMDLYWRDTLTCPTEKEYLEMVGNKTGGLFRLAVRLMQAESPNPALPECLELVESLGLLFQIRDDYLNLVSKEYSEAKGTCEDLTEGKFSFPVIHSIHHDTTNLQLLGILKLRTTDEHVKNCAVQYMERTGSFDYTRRKISTLIKHAKDITDRMDGGEGKKEEVYRLLDKLAI
ncbi:hypothetical protein Purlil1_13681 [Purpureocillium lilacinum]|uniref:Uncharacterized protein n=1 Tax=Purpureocillium lilacinum TaxID=33203 RepID=A0ABR0BDE3_PURLI|nr:hypothetical protein Purlil1_13681 [Purpureocillium lilacinum]